MFKGLVTILFAIFGFIGVMVLALCYAALSWGFVMYKFWGWTTQVDTFLGAFAFCMVGLDCIGV